MTTPNNFWKKIPFASRIVFLLGVFFIFGIIGSAVDTMGMGLQSTTRYLVSVVLFGVFAMVYAISGILLRWRSGIVIPVVILVETVVIGSVLRSVPTPNQLGTAAITHMQRRLALDAGMTIGGMVLAYICFIYVFVSEGRRYFRVHAEMELASEIHRVLVPKIETRIGNFEFYGRSLPSGQVGGDLIDLVRNGEKWVAYIADVSGHGVAPGVLMGMVKSAARMYLSSNGDSDRFLERLNSVLHPIRKPEMFVTLAFLAWDGTQLTFSTAGHPPILQYCSDNRTSEELSCPNPPIGLFSPKAFSAEVVTASKGALFLLCTDGLLEVTNKSNVEFGLEGMKTILSSTDRSPLSAVADRVFEATRAFGHTDDDESLLLIRC
ncbi:MAG TPA: PP2C family protein-serine/threonine phosphatase [Candidatus Sulfotelmatobacter sp.]